MNSQVSTPTIEEFARLVNTGIAAWESAGRILNALIEQDVRVRGRIMDKIPWMTAQVLDGFERIGRGEIYPQLLLDQSPGAHALIALPYDEQKRLHSAEIAILSFRKGEMITLHRRLQELSPKEASLAFSETSVRTIAEQRKLLRPKIPERSVTRTTEVVSREERQEIPESLDDDPKDETVEEHLSAAQARLIRAREVMVSKGIPHELDRFITNALNAIGNLRFEMKDRVS